MIRFSGMRSDNDAHGLGAVVTGMINNNHNNNQNNNNHDNNHNHNNDDNNNNDNNHSDFIDKTTRNVDVDANDDLCWEMGPVAGAPILLLKCDPTVPGQWFTVGTTTTHPLADHSHTLLIFYSHTLLTRLLHIFFISYH